MKIIGFLLVLFGSALMSVGCAIAFIYGVVVMVVDSFFGGLWIAIAAPSLCWCVGLVLTLVGTFMDTD